MGCGWLERDGSQTFVEWLAGERWSPDLCGVVGWREMVSRPLWSGGLERDGLHDEGYKLSDIIVYVLLVELVHENDDDGQLCQHLQRLGRSRDQVVLKRATSTFSHPRNIKQCPNCTSSKPVHNWELHLQQAVRSSRKNGPNQRVIQRKKSEPQRTEQSKSTDKREGQLYKEKLEQKLK